MERRAGNEREPEAEPEFSSSLDEAGRRQGASEHAVPAHQRSSARSDVPIPTTGQAGSPAYAAGSKQPSNTAKTEGNSELEGALEQVTEAPVAKFPNIEGLFAGLFGADALARPLFGNSPPTTAAPASFGAPGQASVAAHNPPTKAGREHGAAPVAVQGAAQRAPGTAASAGTLEQPGLTSAKPEPGVLLPNAGSGSTSGAATSQTSPPAQGQAQSPPVTELAALQLDALQSQASAPAPVDTPGSLSTPLEQASLAEAGPANPSPESGALTSAPTAGDRLDPALSKRSEASRTAPTTSAPTSEHAWSEGEIRARDILRQVQLQFSPAGRQAVIQLQPAELGRIAFRLTVRGGKIDTEVRVERDATLKDLQHALPELRAMLDREGMAGGNLSLSLGFDQSGGGAFQADTQAGERKHAQPQSPAQSAPLQAPAPVPRALAAALAAGLSIDTLA